jgi:hypothetical protein
MFGFTGATRGPAVPAGPVVPVPGAISTLGATRATVPSLIPQTTNQTVNVQQGDIIINESANPEATRSIVREENERLARQISRGLE